MGSEVDCFHMLNKKKKKYILHGTTIANNVCLFIMYLLKTVNDFVKVSLSVVRPASQLTKKLIQPGVQ